MGQHHPPRTPTLEAQLTIAEMLLDEALYLHAEGLGCILARRVADTREQRLIDGHASNP